MQGYLLSLAVASGCGSAQAPAPETPEIESLPATAESAQDTPEAAAEVSVVDRAAVAAPAPSDPAAGLGGRLFDRWFAAVDVDFVPDDPSTKALDGKGGPLGNGTLPGADGKPIPNPGHDYRLKNLLGWDLRGSHGLYGPKHQDKQGVLVPSLLADTDTREHWVTRLTEGGDAFPAYGKVLSAAQIEALVDFLLAVRDGQLPQPDDLYTLNSESPGHYSLKPGADAARGQQLFAERCAGCHGKGGTEMLFDDGEYSLGTLSRMKGYEVAMKILSGQPGTKMAAQVSGGAVAQARDIRDLLAALCDRTQYPKGGASKDDVPDGDPRCGAALK